MKKLIIILVFTNSILNAQIYKSSFKIDSIKCTALIIRAENSLLELPSINCNNIDSANWSMAKIIGDTMQIIKIMYQQSMYDTKQIRKYQDLYFKQLYTSNAYSEVIHYISNDGFVSECDKVKFYKAYKKATKYGWMACTKNNCKNKCHYKK